MRQYKYIEAIDIEKYGGWDIVQIIPDSNRDYIVIVKEDKPTQDYIKLHEATNEELIEELTKRLKEEK